MLGKISMENFEKFPYEFVKPFGMSLDLLGRSFVYIKNRKQSFLNVLKQIFFMLWMLVFEVSLAIRATKVFSGEIPFFDMAFIVPVLMVSTQGILKAAIVVLNKNEIRAIILQLGTSWRTDDLTEIQIQKKNRSLNTLNVFNTVFYWMNILGSWQYMLVPLFETVVRQFILQQNTELLLPFACSFPFDPTESWTRYIAVYIFQSGGMIHLVYLYLGGEFLLITLCGHLSTEFILLQEDLKNVTPSFAVTNENHNEEIKSVIKRHQMLIILSNQLDEIFNRMIFINLLFASITICFFGFVATAPNGNRSTADVVNNIVGVIASILPIFNLCYYAQLLAESSGGVADAAYESLWFHGEIKFQKIITFIIKRSQSPCCLTSLKYTQITLTTFTAVLSTTWSYFSLVTSMYEESS